MIEARPLLMILGETPCGSRRASEIQTPSIALLNKYSSFGVARRPSPRLQAWFDAFMGLHDILPISAEIARQAGELRARLATEGQIRSQADMLVAATAQRHGLTLVTRNVRDFDQCGIALLNPFTS